MIRTEMIKSISEAIYMGGTGEHSSDPYKVIPVARQSIFDFEYEFFDLAYKRVFEEKILKHFYYRYICTTDYAQWKLWLDSKLNDIMPYYNQLYKSATLELNPLYNFVIDVEHRDSGGDTVNSTRTNDKDSSNGTTTQNEYNDSKSGTDTTNNTNSNKNVNKYNNTPQGRLEDVDSGAYLTEATIINDNGSGETKVNYGAKYEKKFKEIVTNKNVAKSSENKEESVTTDRQYTEHVMGRKEATDADLLIRFRETFLNIDLMIMNELNELFESVFHAEDYGIDNGWGWSE